MRENKPMAKLNKIFLTGLITLLPVAITIYIIYSAVIILESLLGSLLRNLLPVNSYIPGLGLLLTLLLIFLFGLTLNSYLTVRFWTTLEKKFLEVPFIKTIYSPLRDVMNLFSKKGDKGMKSVVLVQPITGGPKVLGVVTRDSFTDLSVSKEFENQLAVYIPFSYALGGMTVLVPKESVQEVDIPIEKAMSLAITAWVKTGNESDHVKTK